MEGDNLYNECVGCKTPKFSGHSLVVPVKVHNGLRGVKTQGMPSSIEHKIGFEVIHVF